VSGLDARFLPSFSGSFAGVGAGVSSSRKINTTSPLTGGGDLTADRTLVLDRSVALTWTGTQTFADVVQTGGTKVSTTNKATNFTALATVSVYTLSAQVTVTLASTDPDGTEYVFVDTTGAAAGTPHTLTPNGGLLINGGASYSFARNFGGQSVFKAGGAWYALQ